MANFRDPFEAVLRPGRDVPKTGLSAPASKGQCHPFHEGRFRIKVVVLGQVLRIAERRDASWDDRAFTTRLVCSRNQPVVSCPDSWWAGTSRCTVSSSRRSSTWTSKIEAWAQRSGLARNVFPVPGGPTSSIPVGNGPRLLKQGGRIVSEVGPPVSARQLPPEKEPDAHDETQG